MGPEGSVDVEASSTRISNDPSRGAFLPRGKPKCMSWWKWEQKKERREKGGGRMRGGRNHQGGREREGMEK